MTQTPITVTYSLEEVLSRIEGKIDKLDQKLSDKIDKLDEELSDKIDKLDAKFSAQIDRLDDKIDKLDDKVDKLTVEVASSTTNLNNLDKRVEKIEGTQKNQVWTLITLLGGSLIAVGFRAFFMDNNP